MIEELAERIRSIDINQILDEILDDQRLFILDLIRSQLIAGKGGSGDLGQYAWYTRESLLSKGWIDYKHSIGLFIGGGDPNYDLLGDTGNFYKSLVLTIKASHIETTSLDPKLESIEQSTNMDIINGHVLTLTPENLQALTDRIKPLIQQKINAKFGI